MSSPVNPDASFDASTMTPTSDVVLWEGASADLKNAATGGRLASASYKLTEDGIHFASGMLSTKEEAVPLWAVRDVDLSQSMSQKVRGVGTLRLKLDDRAASVYGQSTLELKSVTDPNNVKKQILNQANQVRAEWNERHHQRTIERNRAAATHVSLGGTGQSVQPEGSPGPSDSSSDTMADLAKLAEMKQAGLLTDEEFAAAKAKVLG